MREDDARDHGLVERVVWLLMLYRGVIEDHAVVAGFVQKDICLCGCGDVGTAEDVAAGILLLVVFML